VDQLFALSRSHLSLGALLTRTPYTTHLYHLYHLFAFEWHQRRRKDGARGVSVAGGTRWPNREPV